jgi:cyclophilin family peptidyl-prolyl cis-trans isomerase
MRRFLTWLLVFAALPVLAKTPAEIVKDSPASDWRPLDLDNTLLMDVGGHGVLIELAPRFAPEHAKNIRTLAHEGYFDGTAVVRVQDNFVTQWGDPDADDKDKAKKLGSALAHLPAEFSIPYAGLPIAKLPDPDGYAPVSGFVDGFPVAADPKRDMAWITHCYGTVGAGRNMAPDSSTGAELYVIIGQSPRALDLNITVVGRVLVGMEYLSALPRGTGNMGFYEKPEQRTAIGSVRLLADVPEDQRPKLQVLKTGSKTWKALVDAKRNNPSDFYRYKVGVTNVCNLTVPTREAPLTKIGK